MKFDKDYAIRTGMLDDFPISNKYLDNFDNMYYTSQAMRDFVDSIVGVQPLQGYVGKIFTMRFNYNTEDHYEI